MDVMMDTAHQKDAQKEVCYEDSIVGGVGDLAGGA